MLDRGAHCVVAIRRSQVRQADCRRVITRPLIPTERRIRRIIGCVLALSEDEVDILLGQVMEEFSYRHRYFKGILEQSYQTVVRYVPVVESLSENRKLLIGSYFTSEYSIQSAGVLNPSIILHPYQAGLREGEVRYMMTFRCVGEGHISSLEFRTCILDDAYQIKTRPISVFVETPEVTSSKAYDKSSKTYDRKYSKEYFETKLKKRGIYTKALVPLLEELRPEFTAFELKEAMIKLNGGRILPSRTQSEIREILSWIDHNVYSVRFPPDTRISGRVLFPVVDNESQGIEDVRMVRFTDDDGTVTYYGTYTGYNGFAGVSKIFATKDFLNFKSTTLTGKAVHNKGLALFPRRINGKYVALSRVDNESNYITHSDDLYHWEKTELIRGPASPWELVQIGNCGSPIETEAGWLVLTHGVGPMRKYCIGIDLLDLNEPTKLIGRLTEPILCPNEYEREGYVPNVVYSCGAVIHHGELIIAYAMSDWETGIATVSVEDVLSKCLLWQPDQIR